MLIASLLIASAWAQAEARDYQIAIQLPPDPCATGQLKFNTGPWPSLPLTVMGEPARLFPADPDSYTGAPIPIRRTPERPLVLIVDGNGFGLDDYDDMSSYLAGKGFNVMVIDRPRDNGPDPIQQALSAIATALATLSLPDDTPVGLIGHSRGGQIAIETIIANHGAANGYNIDLAVLLSPKLDNGTSTILDPEQLPALASIYGSQDNDVGGLTDTLNDAIAAYDRSGDENSTTCHSANPVGCPYVPQMHRLMVYIHGADHSGLVNRPVGFAPVGEEWDPYNNYLSRSDQFCIAKAYTLAMLEWTLNGDELWKAMVHTEHVPSSIRTMTTAAPDELGNPAGTPVRLGLQLSPGKRSVIENFEDGSWNIASQTPNVLLQLLTEGQTAGTTYNNRHVSKIAALGWTQHDNWQLIGFTVPFGRRDVSNFSHLSVRLGQFADFTNPLVGNTPNTEPAVLIGLYDGESSDWTWSEHHGRILPADKRPNGQYQSVMSTLKIPLTAFNGLDKSAIQAVYLALPAGTQGTLLMDSLEWVKE
ncbi:MAG: alpha/beta hydrolase [Chromatiales bacterium]|nr:alpha/beta hydrolase [Chromatiales bacterium]